MEQRPDNAAPCIINEGTIVNKRDMLRALETLDGVEYAYSVEGNTMSSGRALVAQVFASRETSTLLVNNCLFINVGSFEYLRFWQEDDSSRVALHQDSTVLTLTPLKDNEPKPPSRFARQMFPEDVFDEETYVLLEEDGDDEL